VHRTWETVVRLVDLRHYQASAKPDWCIPPRVFGTNRSGIGPEGRYFPQVSRDHTLRATNLGTYTTLHHTGMPTD
jgi:hypothetical protein